jgi:DNA-binding beta-propeller fold protein YncE
MKRRRAHPSDDRSAVTMSTPAFIRIAAVAILAVSLAAAVLVMDQMPIDQASIRAAQAKSDFSAVARYVFLPSRGVPLITVVDRNSDAVVGTLETGLVPEQVVVSEATNKLTAADGFARGVSVVDLTNGSRTMIELDFAPQRLIGSPDGYMVAAADLSGGSVAFVELMRARVAARITGLSPLRDLMFGADGAFLYVAAEGLHGIGVVDVARGTLIEEISVPGLRSAGAAGLTRSPSGRMGYVKTQGNGTISLIDLSNFRPFREIEVARDAVKAFPTGFGGYLVVPDNSEQTVTIIANASLTVAAMLKGTAGMTTVHSGWFDTLALLPSATERKLLVYDLDRLSRAADISLPGSPAAGAVTQDGAKLYLALQDASKVAVIDLQARKLVRTIAAPNPTAAIMARSFDVCH